MVRKREKSNTYYVFEILSGIVFVLIVHYFIILKFSLHPTIQVFIAFILLYLYMLVWALFEKK